MTTSHPCLTIVTGLCLVLGAAGCGSDKSSTDLSGASTVPVSASTATPATDPSTGSRPVDDSIAPPTAPAETPLDTSGESTTSNAPNTEPSSIEPDDPIASAVAVAATPNGVVVDSGENTWDTAVIDDTTLGTPRLIDGFVVYQANSGERPGVPAGPILVSDGLETREFSDGDKALLLLDVVTSRVWP